MKALYYPAWDTLHVTDRPRPEPDADEVLLKVAACGLCGSELETFKTHSPRRTPQLIMGLEFCGIVTEVGVEVTDFGVGDRVVSNALVPCGMCVRCQRGDTHLCAYRQIFGMHRMGAFAEFVNVPVRCLLPWPEGLSAEAASQAEPLANGIHVFNLTQHRKPRTVVVLGAGPIGLMCQQVFQTLAHAKVVVSDLIPERLDVARRLGADWVVKAREEDVVAVAHSITEGEGVDLVIDAVGSGRTKQQSIDACRPGGAVVWIGLHENSTTLDTYGVTLPEKTIYGSYAANLNELQQALGLMATGQVDVQSWVHTFPLDEGEVAFRRMLAAQGDAIKAVLIP
jgi:L-iditol 2-dehydrogenase